jgi:hypothetical protein
VGKNSKKNPRQNKISIAPFKKKKGNKGNCIQLLKISTKANILKIVGLGQEHYIQRNKDTVTASLFSETMHIRSAERTKVSE